jgi:hypothetical protein
LVQAFIIDKYKPLWREEMKLSLYRRQHVL